MDALKAAAIGMAIGIITSLGLVAVFPSSDNYDLQNPYWNGMSLLRHDFSLGELPSLSNLSLLIPFASQDALLIIGPTLPYTQQEANAVSSFARSGGLVVIADDFGSGNQLLGLMNISSRFNGNLLVDPLFNIKAGQLPVITDSSIPGVTSLAFNYATYLNVTDPSAKILAWSSAFSFADVKHTGSYVSGDPLGPFPVVASIHVGRGRVVLISDSSLYLNSMITQADNYASFAAIVGGRQPFVDTSHWAYSGTTQAKALLIAAYRFSSDVGLKYLFVLAGVLALAFVRVSPRKGQKQRTSLDSIRGRHPDWDAQQLRALEEERAKSGNGSII